MSYKIELVDKKDLVKQLEDLFKWNTSFWVRNSAKSYVEKYKSIEIKFAPVYFSSLTKQW